MRLRQWPDVTPEEFYDAERFCDHSTGFCFPGYDKHGGDLPRAVNVARLRHDWLFDYAANRADYWLLAAMRRHTIHPQSELSRIFTGTAKPLNMTETVKTGGALSRAIRMTAPAALPLLHPSWRNSGWLEA